MSITTPLADPSLARGALNEQNIQSLLRTASAEGANKLKEQKLRSACEGFEAVFIQKMWEGMRASLPKEGLMHSREEQFWQGMYDEELGKSMASSGGIGLADMMMTQLSRNLQSATEIAARHTSRKPMEIEPVPLLPKRPAPVQQDAPTAEDVSTALQALQMKDKASAGTGTAQPASPVQEALESLYSGEAPQPVAPAADASSHKQASGQQSNGQQASADAGNPAPPVVAAQLNAFAAQLNNAVSPAASATVQPAAGARPAQTGQPAAAPQSLAQGNILANAQHNAPRSVQHSPVQQTGVQRAQAAQRFGQVPPVAQQAPLRTQRAEPNAAPTSQEPAKLSIQRPA